MKMRFAKTALQPLAALHAESLVSVTGLLKGRTTLTTQLLPCVFQVAENYFYVPDLGQVPEIDVPSYLPDLPGIAADLMYSADLGPGIAPSAPSSAIPELPTFSTESAGAFQPGICAPLSWSVSVGDLGGHRDAEIEGTCRVLSGKEQRANWG